VKRIATITVGLAAFVVSCSATQPPAGPRAAAHQSSRLQELIAERSADGQDPAYRIAPGDKVKVSVAQADELSGDYTVTEDGRILLPLIGEVSAAGETETQFAAKIASALRAQYLQSPEVMVTVASFVGRRVTVTGAVARPGFYELRGGRETIMDLLTRAGGITDDASPKIYFSPASEHPSEGQQVAAAGAVRLQPALLMASADQKPIEIDLTELYQGWTVPALQLPVRSGDVIFVKEGGQVYVQGWVEDPKAYPLKRAMTVTQAIAKAGGLHFGASPGVQLIREDDAGVLRQYSLNYTALRDGSEKDVYLEPGDHIYVPGNPAKVGMWGVYNTITSVIRFSMAGGVAAF
jgi:polysaccharide biosynthesis/export protein